MAAYFQARTTWFDQVVVSALDGGTTQVVAVGAGYDGRSLRYAKPGVRWFELDHPATQLDKRARLAGLDLAELEPIVDDIGFAAADFAVDDVGAALAGVGHDGHRATLLPVRGWPPTSASRCWPGWWPPCGKPPPRPAGWPSRSHWNLAPTRSGPPISPGCGGGPDGRAPAGRTAPRGPDSFLTARRRVAAPGQLACPSRSVPPAPPSSWRTRRRAEPDRDDEAAWRSGPPTGVGPKGRLTVIAPSA